jgi:tRNA threonylcarbamoyladenosine biosynthesis protein TsaB
MAGVTIAADEDDPGAVGIRMKFYMLVLALDTTTRTGSTALRRDGTLLECIDGDARRTHAERLPGDLICALERHGLGVRDVDLFAVAAGPGSLTGLRIGIATMQGLAMTMGRPLAAVSALDAMNASAESSRRSRDSYVGVWSDAHRGEVFSALYRAGALVDGPAVDQPHAVLARWMALQLGDIIFIGDGALMYASAISSAFPSAHIVADVPALAPAIARLAEEMAHRGEAAPADAIRPIYVRRSDVELARERRTPSVKMP